MLKNKIVRSLIILISFFVTNRLFSVLTYIYPDWSALLPDHYLFHSICLIILKLIIPLGVAFALLKKDACRELGIIWEKKAIWAAALFTLPMTVGMSVIYAFNESLSFSEILNGSIQPGIIEELIFRSFLFGLLFRYAGWGFIPASLIGALFFGLGHVYQGNDLMSSFMAFLVTGIGAVWFAWLYAEWRFNAWINTLMHILMNLSWLMYNVDGGAAGSGYANLFRLLTIAASIVVTIFWISKKRGFVINRKVLWTNKCPTDIQGVKSE